MIASAIVSPKEFRNVLNSQPRHFSHFKIIRNERETAHLLSAVRAGVTPSGVDLRGARCCPWRQPPWRRRGRRIHLVSSSTCIPRLLLRCHHIGAVRRVRVVPLQPHHFTFLLLLPCLHRNRPAPDAVPSRPATGAVRRRGTVRVPVVERHRPRRLQLAGPAARPQGRGFPHRPHLHRRHRLGGPPDGTASGIQLTGHNETAGPLGISAPTTSNRSPNPSSSRQSTLTVTPSKTLNTSQKPPETTADLAGRQPARTTAGMPIEAPRARPTLLDANCAGLGCPPPQVRLLCLTHSLSLREASSQQRAGSGEIKQFNTEYELRRWWWFLNVFGLV
jgi:hypothetical protein